MLMKIKIGELQSYIDELEFIIEKERKKYRQLKNLYYGRNKSKKISIVKSK